MPQPPQRRSLETAAASLLSELLPPAQPPDGWSLLSWDCEQGLCLSYHRGGETIYVELERRNDALPCYTRTAAFNINARPVHSASRDIGAGGRGLLAWVERGVRAREAALPTSRPEAERKAMLREIVIDRLLTAEQPGQYYINPYVGCTIGCRFCYVGGKADLSRQIEGLPELQWGHYVDVKTNAAEVLAGEVRTHPPGLVRMSPILTDPYQPAERKYRITRQCLEVMLPAGFTPVILTRAHRIVEDIPLLAAFDGAMAGLSIPTDDDKVRQIFEPGADSIPDRIETLRQLHDAGIVTLLVIQPMLPMNADKLLEAVGPYVDVVRIDRMHFNFVDALYAKHGLGWANSDDYFRRTYERLVTGFAARAVLVDGIDDLAALRDAAVARRAGGRRAIRSGAPPL